MFKQQPLPGKAIVCLPVNRRVNVSIVVNSAWLQRIILILPGGIVKMFTGSGEGRELAHFVLKTTPLTSNSKGFPVLVIAQHQPPGRSFIQSRVIKEVVTRNNTRTINIFADDSFGDDDFNDAIVRFSFIVQ